MSSSTAKVAGRRDSPTWARGNRALSKSVTARPARASNVAAVLPAGPPPITTISQSISCFSRNEIGGSGSASLVSYASFGLQTELR